jgi:hypothetical protein
METNCNLPSRLDLELEKLKLTAERGAKFFTSDKLSLEQEAAFLNYIKAYEHAAQEKKTIKVFDRLGRPFFPSVLSDEEIPGKLKEIFELLENRNISVSSICEVDDREMYRFIIEDLFEYEMIDLGDSVLGTTMFTYEDFYPNSKHDIEQAITDLLDCIQRKSFEFCTHYFLKDSSTSGTEEDIKQAIMKFCDQYDTIKFDSVLFEEPEVINDHASQKVRMTIKTVADAKSEILEAETEFRMVRDCGFWCISGVNLAGFIIGRPGGVEQLQLTRKK